MTSAIATATRPLTLPLWNFCRAATYCHSGPCHCLMLQLRAGGYRWYGLHATLIHIRLRQYSLLTIINYILLHWETQEAFELTVQPPGKKVTEALRSPHSTQKGCLRRLGEMKLPGRTGSLAHRTERNTVLYITLNTEQVVDCLC